MDETSQTQAIQLDQACSPAFHSRRIRRLYQLGYISRLEADFYDVVARQFSKRRRMLSRLKALLGYFSKSGKSGID